MAAGHSAPPEMLAWADRSHGRSAWWDLDALGPGPEPATVGTEGEAGAWATRLWECQLLRHHTCPRGA